MSKGISINKPAPDFNLQDFNGRPVRLSDYRGKKNVILVFNRGFVWPFCRAHMAQLRQDYSKFVEQNTEIIIVGPEPAGPFKEFWSQNSLPFIGLPDPRHSVLKAYGQEVNLFKLGRMPAQVIVDRQGIARFVHYGDSMSDIPGNQELLDAISELNHEILRVL